MEEKSNMPMFIEMANYVSPEITEVRGRNWVNYGNDNNYFQYLLDRYRGSPTNHAIINGIADNIVGDGLICAYPGSYTADFLKAITLFPIENLKRWAFDLKCYGFYIQVIILSKDKKSIAAVDYTPVQNWRSGKANEDGEIEEMWYSDDWTQYRKREYTPEPYQVYKKGINEFESVLVVKPYRTGSFYYPSVDYQGALQYAHIEEEISNFHLNNIMNGFNPSTLINFNNGDPGEEKRRMMEKKIIGKWTGSTSTGKIILSFNDNKETAATVETIQSSDLDKQFQFLSEEATKKIMIGHRVTSPLFFGIRDSSGLGSNADEIKNAWNLYEATVLKPYRQIMLNNIKQVLNDIDISLPLNFISSTPIEFKQELKANLSNQKCNAELLIDLGEEIDLDEWEMIDSTQVDYDLEDRRDLALNLATAVSSTKSGISEQDTNLFKVRYVYAPSGTSSNSREFCKKMVSANKVYKKEDIIKAENQAVNPGWGLDGADTYSIWLYKGGGNCHHYWQRQTYLRKNNKRISVNEARRMILELPPDERDAERLPVNESEVAKRPTDMPKHGFVNKKGY